MPLRIIGYDGAEYWAQLNGKQKDRYPVVTLVLYFGYKKHWDKELSLFKTLNIPEEFQPYINDYKVNLFEIAYLSDEKVKLFKSDFKVVADYFTQKQRTGNYIGSKEELKHVQETLGLLSVMSGDHRFEEEYNKAADAEQGKEIKTMCEVLDRIEARGVAIGEARGISIGEARGEFNKARDMAINLYNQGVGVNIIATAARESVDVVKQWLGIED